LKYLEREVGEKVTLNYQTQKFYTKDSYAAKPKVAKSHGATI
jgi:hypothetical protein